MVVTLDTNIWWDSYPSGANNEIQTQPFNKKDQTFTKVVSFLYINKWWRDVINHILMFTLPIFKFEKFD